MKKIIATLALGTLGLAGCGSTDTPLPKVSEQPTTETTVKTESVLPEVTASLFVKSDKCYDTAGALKGVEVEFGWSKGDATKVADTFRLQYQIDGDEDGPILNEVDVTNGEYQIYEVTHNVSTVTCDTPLTVKVVNIR